MVCCLSTNTPFNERPAAAVNGEKSKTDATAGNFEKSFNKHNCMVIFLPQI
jgi:hypothetical protein